MWLIDMLFPPRVDEAALRGVSSDDFLTLLSPRLAPGTRPGTVVLLPFGDPRVRSAIHEAKYHGSSLAFDLLALVLADYLHDADEGRRPILVPVPLGQLRHRERGFNQTEEVARRAAKLLGGLPVDARLLIRTRETVSQVSLPRREREENMRGAFAPAHPADPDATYILVDDVTTTGATLQAAVDALKEAGAIRITPLALAH